jgi:uncharacterized membrane-anchored protein YhcB (DUF1043 family)
MDIISMAWGLILIAFVFGLVGGVLLQRYVKEAPRWFDEMQSKKWQMDYQNYLKSKAKFEGRV